VSAEPIRVRAHAKINVFLRVLARREEGYHEIESLVSPISLADDVTVRPAERLQVQVRGEEPVDGGEAAPAGGLNLALVAALALADACPEAEGALVEIDKRIPVAGGLGGGSADAAATLRALNQLWGCGVESSELERIAERIGSDVPAMLRAAPIVMAGRGERVLPADLAAFHWALVRFGFGVRSPDAYRWWDADGGHSGPDPMPLLEAAATGDASALGASLYNDLEPSVVSRHPEIGAVKQRLLESGALGAVMSGSGSSVLGLARDPAHARELAAGFENAEPVVSPPPDAG
jgi:4-diphosphocytidyl-2-C-methyl-D-erythritol kinase